MPSFRVARVSRMNSASSSPIRLLKSRIGGTVASPTPTMPMSSDSTRVTRACGPSVRCRAAAAIQPAVPPPTIRMRRIG
jgi:hypothetical protein